MTWIVYWSLVLTFLGYSAYALSCGHTGIAITTIIIAACCVPLSKK